MELSKPCREHCQPNLIDLRGRACLGESAADFTMEILKIGGVLQMSVTTLQLRAKGVSLVRSKWFHSPT